MQWSTEKDEISTKNAQLQIKKSPEYSGSDLINCLSHKPSQVLTVSEMIWILSMN